MIKRLKRRFVFVCMSILLCILFVTFASIFLLMYNSEISISEKQMLIAVQNKKDDTRVEGYVKHDSYMHYNTEYSDNSGNDVTVTSQSDYNMYAPPVSEGYAPPYIPPYNFYGYGNYWDYWNWNYYDENNDPFKPKNDNEPNREENTKPSESTVTSVTVEPYQGNGVLKPPPTVSAYETENGNDNSETVTTSAVTTPLSTSEASQAQVTTAPEYRENIVTSAPSASIVTTATAKSEATTALQTEATTEAVANEQSPPPEPKPAKDVFNNAPVRDNIVVRLNADKQVKNINYNTIKYYEDEGIDYEDLISAVNGVFEKGSESGKTSIGNDKYRYKLFTNINPGGFDLVFIDMSTEISTLERLLFIFMVIAAFGLVVVFIISLVLSNWLIKPVESAWNKQKQFVADASHELKTPLSVISTNADVVMSNPDDYVRNQDKWLSYIKSETFRMSKLVSEMLYIARSDANEIKLVKNNMNLSDVISSVCLVFEPTVFENGKTLHTSIDPNISFMGDEDRIKQLITILIDNAIKHSLPNSNISVSMYLNKQNKIKLCVSNASINIPKNKLNKIFDRFYRIDDSRCRNTGGNGLGLNIAQTIVNYHHGSISAHCNDGIMMFVVTLQ